VSGQPITAASLEARLRARLDEPGHAWLDDACRQVAGDPTRLRLLFPVVARTVGRGPLDADAAAGDLYAWTVDDAARSRLLLAGGPAAVAELRGLYRHGDSAERRGVLRSLDVLEVDPATARALVDEALRGNEPALVAAALGPAGVALLDPPARRQAVLKCVFLELTPPPLPDVDAELARMLAGYALERVCAGRDVPADVWPLVVAAPPADVLSQLQAELSSPFADRRSAAERALAGRAAAAGRISA
jgi:hypothetical protein